MTMMMTMTINTDRTNRLCFRAVRTPSVDPKRSRSLNRRHHRPAARSDDVEQEMAMSHDSINDLMVMSQDSLKQQSNDADDFILNEHAQEPTPSRMMGHFNDEDEEENLLSRTKSNVEQQYPLISNELEIGQLPVIHARRTASENSLYSNSSSSAHMYDSHSLSTSCLTDKDDLTPSNDYPEQRPTPKPEEEEETTSNVGFFDRMKALVTKPVELVQEAIENRRKQRSDSSLNSPSEPATHHENDSLTKSESDDAVPTIQTSTSSAIGLGLGVQPNRDSLSADFGQLRDERRISSGHFQRQFGRTDPSTLDDRTTT